MAFTCEFSYGVKMIRSNIIISLSALSGLTIVAFAALASHALAGSMTVADKAIFGQAVNFQMFHTLALLILGVAGDKLHRPLATHVAILFLAGILAFSGSLYVRALLGPGSLGAFHWITPIGGLLFMAGWLWLAIGAFKGGRSDA